MTNLPQEATGATALSARWNAILDKLQNASDTDVRIRGRKLSAGTVVATTGSFSNISGSGYSIIQDEGVAQTSRSTVDIVGTGVTVTDTGSKTQVSIPSGGAAAYYGVKAEDYITSGAGTDASPYNASAIENAINALPSRGGVVFVKEGLYRGSRISLGGLGQTGRGMVILIVGTSVTHSNQFRSSANNTSQIGTNIQCGFDITANKCLVSFENLNLSPPFGSDTTPTLKYIRDANDTVDASQLNRTIGGFFIRNVRFLRGSPAIWITGQNFAGKTGDLALSQYWNVLIEYCSFISGGQAILIDDGDSTTANSIFLGNIKHCLFQGRASVQARTIEIDIANVKGLYEDWIVEDCGGPIAGNTVDYTIYIDCTNGGGQGGLTIRNIDMGDGSNAAKDAFIRFNSNGGTVRSFVHRKDVDLRGHGDFEFGRPSGVTGVINVLSAGTSGEGGIILRRMQRLTL